jgi:hypothetical protein
LPTSSDPGVSVAICCHNSAHLLPPTLAALAAQQDPGVPWEVLVIDNASSDCTADAAHRLWTSAGAPLRVLAEPQPGLNHARRLAFEQARYPLISFIDDDNWVAEDWVRTAAQFMAAHPDAAACNGLSEAVCEIEPPPWFEAYKGAYAVSTRKHTPGPVERGGQPLFGAGLIIRLAAWRQLRQTGFRPVLVGRQGKRLLAGEDTELCRALGMLGWQLWREPRLRLRHFIERRRLSWDYTRRMYRGMGVSSVGMSLYDLAEKDAPRTALDRLRQSWIWQARYAMQDITAHAGQIRQAWREEGHPAVIRYEMAMGRISCLLRWRGEFDRRAAQTRAWYHAALAGRGCSAGS